MFRRGILSFWAVWFSVVLASNVADALVSLGILSDAWPFASGNVSLIGESIAVYSLGRGTAALLAAGVITWQLAASVLFWRAALEPGGVPPQPSARACSAFAVSLAFWGALLVADELFLVYRHAGLTLVHWCVATAEIVSLLALRNLRDL